MSATSKLPLLAGEFRIEAATEKYHEEIIDLLVNHFLSEEPLNASVNILDDQLSVQQFVDSCKRRMTQGVTLVAIEGTTEKLAGTISVMLIDGRKQSDIFQYISEAGRGRKRETKLSFLKTVLERTGNLFSALNTDLIGDLLTLCVAPTHRGKGLGFLLMSAAVDVSKELGAGAVVSGCTSRYSQCIARKLGLEALSEVKYADYMVDGKKVFQSKEPNTSISIMAKRLP